jgi:hypothetical protein
VWSLVLQVEDKNVLLRNHGGGQGPHWVAAPVKRTMVCVLIFIDNVAFSVISIDIFSLGRTYCED